eukprot:558601-Pleurochrysis_carterae.AAC.3
MDVRSSSKHELQPVLKMLKLTLSTLCLLIHGDRPKTKMQAEYYTVYADTIIDMVIRREFVCGCQFDTPRTIFRKQI